MRLANIVIAALLLTSAVVFCYQEPGTEIPQSIWNTTMENSGEGEENKKFVTIHVLAHSHDDPGFRNTYQEYYWGWNKRSAWGGVRYILDTVVQELLSDKSLKFTEVEMSFFS